MALQPTDQYIVSRSGVNYKVPAGDLSSKLQPGDFMLVNRSGTNYKVSGTDLKGQVVEGVSPHAIGGQVTKNKRYWFHTFYESGTLEVQTTIPTSYVTVCGGGGGGGGQTGGGGGGGGAYQNQVFADPAVPGPKSYTVIIGAGGVGGSGSSSGQDGGTTSISAPGTTPPAYPRTGGGGGGGGGNTSPGRNGIGGTRQGGGGGGAGNTTTLTPFGGSGYLPGGQGRRLGGGGGGGMAETGNGPGESAPPLIQAGNNGSNPANQPFIRAGKGGAGRSGYFQADDNNPPSGSYWPSPSPLKMSLSLGGGGGGGRNGRYVGTTHENQMAYSGPGSVPQTNPFTGESVNNGFGKGPNSGPPSTTDAVFNGKANTGGGGGGGSQAGSGQQGGNGGSGIVIFMYPRGLPGAPVDRIENGQTNTPNFPYG